MKRGKPREVFGRKMKLSLADGGGADEAVGNWGFRAGIGF